MTGKLLLTLALSFACIIMATGCRAPGLFGKQGSCLGGACTAGACHDGTCAGGTCAGGACHAGSSSPERLQPPAGGFGG